MRTRAVLSGLVNNAQFDARLGVRRVHRLFRLALLDILGVKTLRQHSESRRPDGLYKGKDLREAATPSSETD